MLPEAVTQQLGWNPALAPPPIDPAAAPAPPPDWLHPAVLQGLGIAPAGQPAPQMPAQGPAQADPSAPAPPPDGTPAPPAGGDWPTIGGPGAQLPSAASAAPAPGPATDRDFQVAPPGAVAAAPAHPAAPAKPLSIDQQMTANQAKLEQATQEEKTAVNAQTQAKVGEAADAYQAEQTYAAKEADLMQQAAKQRDDRAQYEALAHRSTMDRMKALDDYKIDQNKYWDSMGVGNKIGWFIAMALSGVGNALSGKGNEPNAVIGMLQAKMKQSILAQQDQRDQLEKQYGRAKDEEQSVSLREARKAADNAAAQTDATKMLKIAVDLGTAKAADPIQRANGAKESAGLSRQLALDTGNEIDKKAKLYQAQQQIGIAGGHLALATKQFNAEYGPQGFKQQELDIRAADESRKAQRDADIIALKKAGKLDANEAKFAVSAPVQGSGGRSAVLRNADGEPWLGHQDKEETTKTTGLISAVDEYHQLAGKMIQDIKAHGGEANFIKSDAWQRQQSRLSQIQADLHDVYGIKRFSEGTQTLFDRIATAGIDPTSFVRDASSALTTSAKDLTAKVNASLTAQNYTGKPIEFPDLSQVAAAKPSPEQERQTLLKSKPNISYDSAMQQALPIALREHPSDPVAATRAARAEAEQYKEVSPAQRRALGQLVSQGDDAAETELTQVAASSDSPTVRKMADEGLSTIRYNRDAAKRQAAVPQSQNYDPNAYDPAALIRRFNQQPPSTPTLR